MTQLGVEEPFQVFTSGDATRLFLQDHLNKRVFHLGSVRNQDILQGIPIQTVDAVEHADLVLLSVFIEQNELITQFDELLKVISTKKIPFICANPDKIAMHGSSLRYCARTFAEKLESFGGSVLYYGKPSYDFYNLFYEKYLNQIPREKILMIGDTLETDIKGAHNFHIDSLLVLTGNTGRELQEQNIPVESCSALENHFSKRPTYISENL